MQPRAEMHLRSVAVAVATIIVMTSACSERASKAGPEEAAIERGPPANPQVLAAQIEKDFRSLCLTGAAAPEQVFERARALGWDTFGVPHSMADMDRPWATRTAVGVSETAEGFECAVEHSAADAREVMPILWTSIGAAAPTAEELDAHPFDICRTGRLDGRKIEACSADFMPHGVASRLSVVLASPGAPQSRQ